MKYYILILAFILAACGASKKTVKDDSGKSGQVAFNESFDPLSLNDDDLVIEARNAGKKEVKDAAKNNATILPVKEMDGYRVQIVATKNIETASLIEQEATDQFLEKQQKIYLIFEAPLYKVRIGDFTDRDEAEQVQSLARSIGYREAFIVKTKVIPRQEADFPNQR